MEHGRQMIIDTLTNGEALNRFERMLVNQNVDPDLARSLCSGAQSLPLAKYRTPLTAKSSGNNLISYHSIAREHFESLVRVNPDPSGIRVPSRSSNSHR